MDPQLQTSQGSRGRCLNWDSGTHNGVNGPNRGACSAASTNASKGSTQATLAWSALFVSQNPSLGVHESAGAICFRVGSASASDGEARKKWKHRRSLKLMERQSHLAWTPSSAAWRAPPFPSVVWSQVDDLVLCAWARCRSRRWASPYDCS